MLIYFLRHGDASSDSHIHDNERPLTDLGVHQATLIGAFLKRMNIHIDTIISSPLARAQQTASIIQENINKQQHSVTDFLLNGTDQHQLIKHLNNLGVSSALLVGHAPHLSGIISLLVGGNFESEIEMKKCSLALVEVPEPICPGSGLLKQLTHVDTIAKFMKP
jgi:phosphohistidine phosphatase